MTSNGCRPPGGGRRRTRSRARSRALALGVGLACVLGSQPLAGQSQSLAGEYGLYVTDSGGEIGVAWLTDGAHEGVLRVVAGDSVLLDARTPAAGSHRAAFPRPDRDVEIRFGALGAELRTTTLYLGPPPRPESGELTGVDSLYLVGDVHGEHERLLRLLHNAELVDEQGRWSGGERHVAFLGDLFDRGDDVTRTLWFLYRLEREARAAGGGAHVVLGNHETMVFTDDLRYVSAKELLVARLHGVTYREMFDIRATVLGRWLAGRPGLMHIDGALLAHGGVVPEIRPHSVAAVNDSVRAFLAEDAFYLWGDETVGLATDSTIAAEFADQYERIIVMDSAAVARRMQLLFDERSIVWYRGYVQSDTLGAELERVLANFDADVHVVGHTPVPEVGPLYDGRLWAVDLEEAASEMLLLARDASGERRAWRLYLEGPPEPL